MAYGHQKNGSYLPSDSFLIFFFFEWLYFKENFIWKTLFWIGPCFQDYDQLDMANECDTLGDFLKLSEDEKKTVKVGITGILPEERKAAAEAQKEHKALTNGAPREVGAC